jgi:hypothetical protein
VLIFLHLLYRWSLAGELIPHDFAQTLLLKRRRRRRPYYTTTITTTTVMIYTTLLLSSYNYCVSMDYTVQKEYHHNNKPMPVKGKKDNSSSVLLPSCFRCGATLDLELIECFGSRRIIVSNDDEGKSYYYCNNPLCAPDEEQQKHRLLPFSWWNN